MIKIIEKVYLHYFFNLLELFRKIHTWLKIVMFLLQIGQLFIDH